MRIFSGIQPTGRKHLGNYIGAITQYVAGQDRGEAIYCVVDLHAITVAYEPPVLREAVYDTAATLLAAGLEPERCIFFRQSDVQEHSELCWLLSAVTSFGELNRMTQFKDKAGAQRDLVSAGLFFYPVLQAADVLAYRAHEVPVGEDQRQHIELMRDAAERFNARFGETLVVPEARIPAGGRADHGSAGARSQDVHHRRDRAGHRAGARRARRDRQEGPLERHRLGVRGAARSRQGRHLEPHRHPGGGARHRPRRGGARVRRGRATAPSSRPSPTRSIEYLAPVRERYNALRGDEPELERILDAGAEKARAIAADTMEDVRQAMGVGPVRPRR